MSVEIDIQWFKEKFERNVKFFICKVMIHHIPYKLKLVEEIPKKVDKMLPVDKFKNHMQNIIYGLHKALGSDGSNMVYGGPYLIDLKIHNPFTYIEYDYIRYIIEKMKEQITATQRGEFENFKFYYYLLLMHLILYKNVGYFSTNFIDQTSNLEGEYLV